MPGPGDTAHIIRAPNHLGDLVMALPALERAGTADVLLVRGLVPLLAMSGVQGEVLPLDRGLRGLVRAAGQLRNRRYRRGTLLTPSLSSALVFAAAGIPERRGTATDARSALLTDRLRPDRLAGWHRSGAYHVLVTGDPPPGPLTPRLVVAEAARERWRRLSGNLQGPLVGLFPGSNAASRRWPAGRYRALADRMAGKGFRVVVFGGPQERELTAEVAAGGALDLGGRTDLPLLAAGLAECTVLVTNDSGPLHLAAAVGTPTLSLWGPGDPSVTGPLGAGHRLLRHPELRCVPCVKNACPRSGRGDILPDAKEECLALIGVDEVAEAAEQAVSIRHPMPG